METAHQRALEFSYYEIQKCLLVVHIYMLKFPPMSKFAFVPNFVYNIYREIKMRPPKAANNVTQISTIIIIRQNILSRRYINGQSPKT